MFGGLIFFICQPGCRGVRWSQVNTELFLVLSRHTFLCMLQHHPLLLHLLRYEFQPATSLLDCLVSTSEWILN